MSEKESFENKFYRSTDYKLFKIYGGWMVLAKDVEQVKGLACKRSGNVPYDSEIELVEHNATVIEGVYDDYQSVCIDNAQEIENLRKGVKEIMESTYGLPIERFRLREKCSEILANSKRDSP